MVFWEGVERRGCGAMAVGGYFMKQIFGRTAGGASQASAVWRDSHSPTLLIDNTVGHPQPRRGPTLPPYTASSILDRAGLLCGVASRESCLCDVCNGKLHRLVFFVRFPNGAAHFRQSQRHATPMSAKRTIQCQAFKVVHRLLQIRKTPCSPLGSYPDNPV